MLMNNENKKEYLVRDPVCGMKIEPDDAVDVTIYKGKIYYFCAHSCSKKFNEQPDRFINNSPEPEKQTE